MQTIEIKPEAAAKAIKQAQSGDSLSQVLETLLGPIKDTRHVTERITTTQDILSYKGHTEDSFVNLCAAGGMTPDEIGHRLMKWGCEAYNEGWVPDFADGSQPKYTIWMEYVHGSGFRFDYSVRIRQCSTVGSRLVFKSKSLADAFAKHFTPLINQAFS